MNDKLFCMYVEFSDDYETTYTHFIALHSISMYSESSPCFTLAANDLQESCPLP